jgi:Lon protease-like protein
MTDGPGGDRRDQLARAASSLKVFPLPGVVVLPGTATPFHIFEPRYRAMTAAALGGDRTLCIATLVRDGEQLRDRPALHPVAGAGFIEADEQLPDGRYRLLFHCTDRVRLDEELHNGRDYREFRASLLADRYPAGGPAALSGAVEALDQLVYDLAKVLPAESGAPRLAAEAARQSDPGRLADLVAAAVVSEPAARLHVLEAVDVRRRLELVTEEVAAVLLVLSRGRTPSA